MNARRARLLLWAALCGAVLGLLISVSKPRTWSCGVVLAPEVTTRSMNIGSLSRLSSISNLMTSTMDNGQDAIKPLFYPDVVKSTPFLLDILRTEVVTADSTLKTSLVDYMLNHQKQAWWDAALGLPGQLFNRDKGPSGGFDPKAPNLDAVDPQQPPKVLWDVVLALSRSINMDVNYRNRKVRIVVEMQDPSVAFATSNAIVDNLRRYVENYRSSKLEEYANYLEAIEAEQKQAEYEALERLARANDASHGLVSETAKTELQRLKADLDNLTKIRVATTGQLVSYRIKLRTVAPVFEVIQPAVYPVYRTGPRTGANILGLALLAVAILCIVFYLKGKPAC